MMRLVVPKGVGLIVVDGVVYIAPLPGGPITVLDGIAAFIWDAVLDVDKDAVARTVAEATSTPVAEIEATVTRFVDDLIRRGLLVPRG